MKLPNRITTTAEAPPGEYQRSLYLSLRVPDCVQVTSNVIMTGIPNDVPLFAVDARNT